MSKVRINDLARELEVKAKPILEALASLGLDPDKKKTHSSSIEADEAEKVRDYLSGHRGSSAATKPPVEAKPAFNLANISKPGDAVKAILARKQAEEEARNPLLRRRSAPVAAPAEAAAIKSAPAAKPVLQGCTLAEAARPDCDTRGTAAGDCEQASRWACDCASARGGCSPAPYPCNTGAAGGNLPAGRGQDPCTRCGGPSASGGGSGGSCCGARDCQACEGRCRTSCCRSRGETSRNREFGCCGRRGFGGVARCFDDGGGTQDRRSGSEDR
jgi:hypothetical protein